MCLHCLHLPHGYSSHLTQVMTVLWYSVGCAAIIAGCKVSAGGSPTGKPHQFLATSGVQYSLLMLCRWKDAYSIQNHICVSYRAWALPSKTWVKWCTWLGWWSSGPDGQVGHCASLLCFQKRPRLKLNSSKWLAAVVVRIFNKWPTPHPSTNAAGHY